ncbi:hypothetical protein BH23BAC1_BH23BAC1_09740 [soil metagenome]
MFNAGLNFGNLQAQYMMKCWASQKDYQPISLKYAEGCWLYTEDGGKIFDLRSAHNFLILNSGILRNLF